MSRFFKWLYLSMIFVVVGILWVGISRTGQVPGTNKDGPGYRPIAVKIEEARDITSRAEAQIMAVTIDPEYDRLITIPGGPFVLGDRDGGAIEQPERIVTLSAFAIDAYETTFAQYYAFVNAAGHRKPRLYSYPNVDPEPLRYLTNAFNPVVGVAWEDALAYCLWRGKRLPTEAEWERAAKGTDRRAWPWGDRAEPHFANLVGDEDGFKYTAPVGAQRRDRSPEGVFDLTGNVMEWTSDWFDERAYATVPASDPSGPPRGVERVIRGASWNDSLHRGRTTTRFKMRPDYLDITIGFRCVRSAEPLRRAQPPATRESSRARFSLDSG